MVTKYFKKVYKTLKKWGVLGYNKKENIFGLHPLAISTFYIIFTLGIAAYLRRVVKNTTKDNVFRQMLLEFIATAELCASCFELIIVADNYGIWAYALYLFILTVYWSSKWENASACPYTPIEDVFEGIHNLAYALLLIFAQVLGGLAIFRYIQILWSLELAETHRGKAYQDCEADLQVPMIIGAVIEGVSTCMCRIMSRVLAETDARFGTILDAFFGTLMVVAAFNFSGGYFNPALATSLKYNCRGNTFTEHMVVYWLGAFVGSISSIFLYKSKPIQQYIAKIKPKTQ